MRLKRPLIANLAIVFATQFICLGASSQTTWNIVPGWNLLGNYTGGGSIDIATSQLSDPSKVNSVWLWNNGAAKWQFYAPSMNGTDLAAYIGSRGYYGLSNMFPTQGFWVNASKAFILTSASNGGATLAENNLNLGWNLVGGASKKTPSVLYQSLRNQLNAAGKDLQSLWAWDNASSTWKFYAPSLDAQGGTALTDYINSKSYKPFTTDVLDADGIWMKIGKFTPVSCVSPQVPNSVGNECVGPPLLSSTPILLPDLKPIYDTLCGNGTNVQTMTLVDLNKDGRKDLVFNLWCSQATMGTITDGPVPNRVIAFLQQPDGTFKDGTKDVFGSDYIDIGGSSLSVVVHDFNNDGYDDFVFAVNREDGRGYLNNLATNFNTQNVFFTSNGIGGYNITKQGQSAWNYTVNLMDNDQGGKDVISTPIGYNGVIEVWHWSGSWSLVGGYDWVTGPHPVFFKNKAGSNVAVTPMPYPDVGLRLHTKTNSIWSMQDSWVLPVGKKVPWINWSNELGTNRLVNIEGKDYVSVTTGNICELKLKKDDLNSIAVVLMSGLELTSSYIDGTTLTEGVNMVPKEWLAGYEVVGNKLQKSMAFKVNNEVQSVSDVKFACEDVNDDGYDDIVIVDWRANKFPLIYINDTSGTFNLTKSTLYPGLNAYQGGQPYVYEDITGDGIRDILYFPINGIGNRNTPTQPIQYRLYKGIREIENTDLVQ